MPDIYLVPGPASYLKLCTAPNARRNHFGLIENNGTLNVKIDQLPEVRRHEQFQPSKSGSTRGVGGTGYAGWLKFENIEKALEFLQPHYDLIPFKQRQLPPDTL
jgi:hypothetical protein